jgi:hypothetical protein
MIGQSTDLPLAANDTAFQFAHIVNAGDWIGMLAAPKLWAALRRVPPKAFLLELVETYLVYAKSHHLYAHIPEDQPRPDLSLRGPAVERLLALLREWEPPTVTHEIRETARAIYFAEHGAPPKKPWDELENDFPDIPLESTLVWPEGPWDEEAFIAEPMAPDANPSE